MKFKQLFQESNKDEIKYNKLKQRLMSGKNLTDKEEDWYTDYQVNKYKKKYGSSREYQKKLENYLSTNKKYQELIKKKHDIWEQMEADQPGPSKDQRKWFKLKKEYDRLSDEIDNIKKDFYNKYEW